MSLLAEIDAAAVKSEIGAGGDWADWSTIRRRAVSLYREVEAVNAIAARDGGGERRGPGLAALVLLVVIAALSLLPISSCCS